MKAFFLIFLVVPLIEIYFLIEIGSAIGAGLTIFLVVFTAALGAVLVRMQGFATFVRAQTQLVKGEMPALEMIEGLCLFVAGALLLTPGFFTDAIGFILLTPSLRRAIIRKLLERKLFMNTRRTSWTHRGDKRHEEGQGRSGGRVIDIDPHDPD